MPLVALVQVDDHGREALEGAGARERPGVERPPGRQVRRQRRARSPSRLRRRRRRTRPRRVARRRRGSMLRANGAPRAPDPVELGLDSLGKRCRLDRRQSTPPFVNRSSDATESTGAAPIASRSSRAVSSAASAFDRENDEVGVCARVSVRRTGAAELARRLLRACLVTRADDDVDPGADEPRGERATERPRPADDGYAHAAARIFSASRRSSSRSRMSVLVTTSSTSASAGASASSMTSASIKPS